MTNSSKLFETEAGLWTRASAAWMTITLWAGLLGGALGGTAAWCVS